LTFGGCANAFSYTAASHPALCPGQTAELILDGQGVGWLGLLHPALAADLDLTYCPMLFEVEIDRAFAANVPVFVPISKFPTIRRDLAFVLDESVDIAAIEATVRDAAGPLLQSLKIFDIYRGKGIDSGRKSVALGLILQETSRTLTDEDADGVTHAVSEKLAEVWKAKIRD
jgi:phenylalanyl-tRNA synthetase beta chain